MSRGLKLERHIYAPELNKLFYKGICFKVPGALGIKSAIDKVGIKKPEFKKHCKITVRYCEEYKRLNCVKSGTFANYAELKIMIKKLKEYHKGGKLLNGDTLPAPRISVKIQSLYL